MWPLFFLKPKFLIDPSEILDDGSLQADEARLRDIPPPCGERLFFHQGIDSTEACGGFIFSRKDVEEHLKGKLSENPHLHYDHEGAILNWVTRHYNPNLSDPISVPKTWHRFEYIANQLIDDGLGEVHCLTCQTYYDVSKLTADNDRGLPGWNFNRQLCPEGHLLLMTRGIHISMRSEREPQEVMEVDKIRCRFDYVCPKEWSELKVIDNPNERFCDHCNESVHLAYSETDLDHLAREGKCAALMLQQDQGDYLDIPAFKGRLVAPDE
ncbi:hypothetical protein GZ77_04735 [Endozoicomonas montiporae]|uniref:Uncharacterized protein n=2 Tax=Endozoicomonas montiporae TaxID=1027273 RepID=A0A081NBK7_9GAMM|nr:hypothetical protein [Endozoicomonas montiporae]AMO56120.1 hypothetical protein EZMO1_1997 [Endozoicomonas montiporae CL-33]KEQ15830.1 hypothetical protein GZ77_04735 [Endozoicomonas montiporae]